MTQHLKRGHMLTIFSQSQDNPLVLHVYKQHWAYNALLTTCILSTNE